MNEPKWVQRRVVDAMHEALLNAHGGAAGVRDEGLLESALARPRNIFQYEACDIERLAAAYVSGIVRNHPFVDGNKRTGFMTGYVFLERNGFHLTAGEAVAARAVLDLAAGTLDEEGFTAWLRDNVKRAVTPRKRARRKPKH